MMRLKTIAILSLMVLTGIIALTTAAQVNDVTIVGGDETATRELLTQLAIRRAPFDTDTTIFIGQPPDNLPFDLPLPEQTRMLGGISQGMMDGTSFELFLSSELSGETVTDFYRQSFSGPQWRSVDRGLSGGFGNPVSMAGFCLDDNAWYLSISGIDRRSGGSDTTFYIQGPAAGSACSTDGSESIHAEMYALIPSLRNPTGITLRSSGGGGGGGGPAGRRSVSTEANLVSSGPEADTILADYNGQLETAGWILTDTAGDQRAGWSTWQFTSDEGVTWGGTLTLTRSPLAANEYYALLRIEESAN